MSESEQTVLMIAGAISRLPDDEQVSTNKCIAAMRLLSQTYGTNAYILSIALLGAELQQQAEGS